MSASNKRKPFEQLLTALSPRRRILERLRAAWARPGAKDSWLADRYFELTRDESARNYVDDRSWADLEFPRIFSDLDSTVTPLGGQTLFQMMRQYLDDESELIDRCRSYAALRSDAALREEIQLGLSDLDADSNASIADFVFGKLPEKPKYHRLLPWWGLLSAATLVGVITLSVPIGFWFAIVAINFVVMLNISRYLHRDNESLKSCYRLLGLADGLSRIQSDSHSLLQPLAEERALRAAARSRIRWFAISQGEIANNLLPLFNVAFLIEYIIYVRAIDRLPEI